MDYPENPLLICGRNPIIEALKSGREIDKILVAGNFGSVKVIYALAKERGIILQRAERGKLDEIAHGASHQGVVAYAAAVPYRSVEDILSVAASKGEAPFIVLLDEITDPRNLGSIIRTANGAGAHGVIITERRSSGLGDIVAKTSAGALEYTPVAKVVNLVRTIEELKKRNIWFYCAAPEADTAYDKVDYNGGVGLVIGSEGKGVSRLTAEACDFRVGIPMRGEINSLNAAVSAGIMMYEICKYRLNKKGG